MSIFGKNIIFVNEKEVPTTDKGDETNYDLDDEGDETPKAKVVKSTEDEEESDYDLPAEEEEETTEEPGDEESTEEPTDDSGEEDPVEDEEVEIGAELFADLNDDQKIIRDKELYNNFYKLYNTLSDFVIKINKVVRTKDTIHRYDFISDKSEEVKDILYDYIIDTYKTRTYLENHNNYYEFLASFNQFVKMIEEMGRNTEEKQ